MHTNIAIALPAKPEDGLTGHDHASSAKIVKLFVVKPDDQAQPSGEVLATFEETMLPHLDAAHNLARWLLRSQEDAQDIVQEAYLRAFKSFGGFRGTNGRAWLLTIVRNTAFTFLKKKSAVATVALDEQLEMPGDDSITPTAILQRLENTSLVSEAIEALPAEFREILILRHQEELSYKQISEIIQVPQGTVMSRLARARAKLKEYLTARLDQEK